MKDKSHRSEARIPQLQRVIKEYKTINQYARLCHFHGAQRAQTVFALESIHADNAQKNARARAACKSIKRRTGLKNKATLKKSSFQIARPIQIARKFENLMLKY